MRGEKALCLANLTIKMQEFHFINGIYNEMTLLWPLPIFVASKLTDIARICYNYKLPLLHFSQLKQRGDAVAGGSST